MQNRRSFIKSSCTICGALATAGFITTVLESCGTSIPLYKATIDNYLINVPLSSFKENHKMITVRNNKLKYDVLLIKLSETEFRALYMKCTHRDNQLIVNDKGLFCDAHGSSFDLEGNVNKEPAERPLKKFTTTVADNFVVIDLKS